MGETELTKLETKLDELQKTVNQTNIDLAGFKGRVWGVTIGISSAVGVVTSIIASVLTIYFAK